MPNSIPINVDTYQGHSVGNVPEVFCYEEEETGKLRYEIASDNNLDIRVNENEEIVIKPMTNSGSKTSGHMKNSKTSGLGGSFMKLLPTSRSNSVSHAHHDPNAPYPPLGVIEAELRASLNQGNRPFVYDEKSKHSNRHHAKACKSKSISDITNSTTGSGKDTFFNQLSDYEKEELFRIWKEYIGHNKLSQESSASDFYGSMARSTSRSTSGHGHSVSNRDQERMLSMIRNRHSLGPLCREMTQNSVGLQDLPQAHNRSRHYSRDTSLTYEQFLESQKNMSSNRQTILKGFITPDSSVSDFNRINSIEDSLYNSQNSHQQPLQPRQRAANSMVDKLQNSAHQMAATQIHSNNFKSKSYNAKFNSILRHHQPRRERLQKSESKEISFTHRDSFKNFTDQELRELKELLVGDRRKSSSMSSLIIR